ncbi:MAG TPA: cytochrome P450 [Candidatus Binatia bacterium]|nr:cytochrome P450 [Candidatus Binatia bacterium]
MARRPYWDPYDDAIRRSPYDAWRALRDEAPVYYNPRYEFYALSRFDDVLAASIDCETFSSAYGITLDDIGRKPEHPLMIMLDPPEHDVLRKIVSGLFTPRAILRLEARIRELCAGYLEPFVGSRGFDYVREFGMRLPVMVISSLLGFPEEDHDQLREWSDAVLHREEGNERLTEEGKRAQDDSYRYYWNAVQERRRSPRDDLVSQLLSSEIDDGAGGRRALTDVEAVRMIGLISAAGNETVARHLGWAAIVLGEWPDERRKLVADRALVPNAVEELLRFEAPSPTQGRYATRPATMHGTTIPAGSKVALLTGSAGRDERRYPDADRFDVGRKLDRHVTLGYGVHYCLGAALARLEGRVALEETLARFPEWHVDRSEVRLVETNTVRGPASCPIRW